MFDPATQPHTVVQCERVESLPSRVGRRWLVHVRIGVARIDYLRHGGPDWLSPPIDTTCTVRQLAKKLRVDYIEGAPAECEVSPPANYGEALDLELFAGGVEAFVRRHATGQRMALPFTFSCT